MRLFLNVLNVRLVVQHGNLIRTILIDDGSIVGSLLLEQLVREEGSDAVVSDIRYASILTGRQSGGIGS